MRLHLIRHGETVWNREMRIQGMTDIPLNANGRSQAAALGKRFEDTKLDLIFSSDLSRAWSTAKRIRENTTARLIKDERLREQFMGDWEGMRWALIEKEYYNLMDNRRSREFRPPGGESRIEFYQRIAESMESIIGIGCDEVAVVSHGAAIRMMLCYLTKTKIEDDSQFRTDNTCVYCLEGQDDKWQIVRHNDTTHVVKSGLRNI